MSYFEAKMHKVRFWKKERRGRRRKGARRGEGKGKGGDGRHWNRASNCLRPVLLSPYLVKLGTK